MQKKWFHARKHGFGWTPATWQGWAIALIFLLSILQSLPTKLSLSTLVLFLLRLILLTTVLIVICYLTGEKPHWQWGKKKEQQ